MRSTARLGSADANGRSVRFPLSTVAGTLSLIVCVSLAGVAFARYPWAFSPMTNWISDLGNTWLNPRGSVFFRVDMVVVGVGLSAFFLGLRTLTHGQHWGTKSVILLAQLTGLVSSAALVMTGVFSENQESAHALWSTILFIALAVTVMLLGCGALAHPRVPTWISFFALIACAADVTSIVARTHWLEWVAVPLLLVVVGQVSYGTWRVASERPPRRELQAEPATET
jgi:hypothetical membrane protein